MAVIGALPPPRLLLSDLLGPERHLFSELPESYVDQVSGPSHP